MPGRRSKEGVNELSYALAVTRATLEATADGILAVDEAGRITGWNAKFLEMWRIPEDLIALRDAEKVRAGIAVQLKDPKHYLARIVEIENSTQKSFDLLELADGGQTERYSEVILVDEDIAGRVWSFRSVTERNQSELIARRLA